MVDREERIGPEIQNEQNEPARAGRREEGRRGEKSERAEGGERPDKETLRARIARFFDQTFSAQEANEKGIQIQHDDPAEPDDECERQEKGELQPERKAREEEMRGR